jgi:hypothetical protein
VKRALLAAAPLLLLAACKPGELSGGLATEAGTGGDGAVPGDAPWPTLGDNGQPLPDQPRRDGPKPVTKDSKPSGSARFFRANSLWNTPISNEPVQWRDEPGLRSGPWWVNYDEYANNVVIASASDPLVSVKVPNTWGWPAGTIKLRIPSGVSGSAGTDGFLVVIDGTTAYDFWQFVRDSNTSAHVSAWAKADIATGSGWGSYSPFLSAGIRAAGSSGLAGQIYGNELTQGINHALALAATSGAGLDGDTRPPAISSDGPAESTRLGIPPGTPKPAGLSAQGSHAWDAMQKYGAWLVDRMDGASPIALNADPRSVPQTDINALNKDLGKISAAARVVVYDYPHNP